MLRKKDGFSSIELMIVIGIIAIVCGIALPTAINWIPKYKQSSAARDVMSIFEKARILAVKRNSYTLVEEDFSTNKLKVYLCEGSPDCTDPVDPRKALFSGMRIVHEYSLPSGMKLKNPSSTYASLDLPSADQKFTNIARPHFRFSKQGYPVDALTKEGDLMRGSVCVSSGSSYEDKLVFISAGGNVKIKRPDPNDAEIKN